MCYIIHSSIMSHTQGDLKMKTVLVMMIFFTFACESENDGSLSGPGSYDPECYEMCVDNFIDYYESVYSDTGVECNDKYNAWLYVYFMISGYFKDLKSTGVYNQLSDLYSNSEIGHVLTDDECTDVEVMDTKLMLNQLVSECSKSYC